MKHNFFVAFSIFALVYIGSNSVAGQDLRARATEVLKQANGLNQQLVAFRNQEETVKNSVPGITDRNIRNGVLQTSQVTELNQKLSERSLKRGIVKCIKVKDDGINKIVTELAPGYRSSVDEKLDAQLRITNSALENIGVMRQHLQGNLLETTIKVCESKTGLCAITNSYPQELTQFTNEMNSNRQILNSVFEDVYKQQINSQIPAKVINEVYNPTSNCIKNVDNTGGSAEEAADDSSNDSS